jgi:hypothetical protein
MVPSKSTTQLGLKQLKSLKASEGFSHFLELLYNKQDLDIQDAEYLYSVALLFIEEFNKYTERKYYIEYSYTIILITALKTKNYNALYDFAINYGFYPIAKKISELKLLPTKSLFNIISEACVEQFDKDNIVYTQEQKNTFEKLLKDKSNKISLIAPTSYGKSQLIFEHMKNFDDMKVIAIIVPTKALINQMWLDAKKHNTKRKMVMHDQIIDSYDFDKKLLLIVTQERALRLIEKRLKDKKLKIDVLYIDESHNLLDFDFKKNKNNRSILLSRLIKISRRDNPNLIEMYLSPVLSNSDNLKISQEDEISSFRIEKNLKVMDINYVSDNEVKKYDRFVDEFIEIGSAVDCLDYVKSSSKSKNLHYLYRPKFIQEYSNKLFNELLTNESCFEELQNELRELVHEDFDLVNYLSKGILYIHGQIPANIKNYLLHICKNNSNIRHIVSNKVILEGINFPIDNLFYISGFSNKKDLVNLIGRVNRLNNVFSSGNANLDKLLVPIHFVEMSEYPQNRKAKLENLIKKLRKNIEDDNEKSDVKNPLLENYKDKYNSNNEENGVEIIQSEKDVLKNDENDYKTKLVKLGLQQFLNYTDQGIKDLENKINDFISYNLSVLESVKRLFFDGFSKETDFNPIPIVSRLAKQETINYYEFFNTQRHQNSFSKRVENLVGWWRAKLEGEPQWKLYVGRTWGEEPWVTENYPDSKDLVYIDVKKYLADSAKLNNIAITKICIDDEFVNYYISIFANALLELEVIDSNKFNEFMYGTKNSRNVKLYELGVSSNVVKALIDNGQIDNYTFDEFGNLTSNSELEKFIKKQSGYLKFELEQYFFTYNKDNYE